MSTDPRAALLRRFPGFSGAPALVETLLAEARPARLDAGTPICRPGERCTHLALVLAGRARVYELGESGRELTLYRVHPGECCILTASCILGDRRFPASAVCETALEALLLPAARVDPLMAEHGAWRRFVWRLLADRLGHVLSRIEDVAFRRLDERLIRLLLAQAAADGTLTTTHQRLADELGTSREGVSRALKELEQRGLLTLGRGQVCLNDRAALAALLPDDADPAPGDPM